METKTIKLNVPEGYEIDKEKSTFENIVLNPKPKEKYPTYEDLQKQCIDNGIDYNSLRQFNRVNAYNQLLNITLYYNTIHPCKKKINEEYNVYYIFYDKKYKDYFIGKSFRKGNEAKPLFNRKKDAQAVLDNPNFKTILKNFFE